MICVPWYFVIVFAGTIPNYFVYFIVSMVSRLLSNFIVYHEMVSATYYDELWV